MMDDAQVLEALQAQAKSARDEIRGYGPGGVAEARSSVLDGSGDAQLMRADIAPAAEPQRRVQPSDQAATPETITAKICVQQEDGSFTSDTKIVHVDPDP